MRSIASIIWERCGCEEEICQAMSPLLAISAALVLFGVEYGIYRLIKASGAQGDQEAFGMSAGLNLLVAGFLVCRFIPGESAEGRERTALLTDRNDDDDTGASSAPAPLSAIVIR